MPFGGMGAAGRILTPPLPALNRGAFQTIRGKVTKVGKELLLELPRAVKLEGRSIEAIVLRTAALKAGQRVTVHGRLDSRQSDHALVLSGISNVGNGEPRFDAQGHRFLGTRGASAGQVLPSIFLNGRDLPMGEPLRVAVIDSAQKKVFFASQAGLVAPGENAFQGVEASAPLRIPSRADHQRWVVAGGVVAKRETLQPLECVAREGLASWFHDEPLRTWVRLTARKIDALFSVK